MQALSKLYNYLRCIPRTLLFNFYYLPFKQAIGFPIIVSHRTKFQSLKGKISVPDNAKAAHIQIGFGKNQVADNKYSRLIWNIERDGVIKFGNDIKICSGCKLYISGTLIIGSGTNFSGESSITCNNEISFGKKCLISWQTIFMDTDFHHIVNKQGTCLNPDMKISIGNHVWICARCTVIKGTIIGDNCIISISSNVVSSFSNNHIIGGNPAKIIGSMVGKSFCH